MKLLKLEMDACVQCPYYRFELVLKESGRGYDGLHACKKSARALVYAEKVNRDNDPEDVIPKWCELPNNEEGVKNGMQETSSQKEEGLSRLSGGGGPG